MTLVQMLLISLFLNAFFFIIAAVLRTDVFTDITYSMGFALLSAALLLTRDNATLFQVSVSVAVIVWAARLGSYLFWRILHIKIDHRFDDKRNNPVRFGLFWLIQAITIWIVMFPVYGFFSAAMTVPPLALLIPGAALYLAGLVLEAVADIQKYRFKSDPANRGRFISSGVWGISRHPNYLGEMMIWWGISLPGLALFRGIELAYFLGPLFITLMLLFVSGIPLLEKSADEKWGNDPAYAEYKRSTPVLVPFLVRRPAR